jgi:uncharacterized membrane protein YjjB (DUF3815 family)
VFETVDTLTCVPIAVVVLFTGWLGRMVTFGELKMIGREWSWLMSGICVGMRAG